MFFNQFQTFLTADDNSSNCNYNKKVRQWDWHNM